MTLAALWKTDWRSSRTEVVGLLAGYYDVQGIDREGLTQGSCCEDGQKVEN